MTNAMISHFAPPNALAASVLQHQSECPTHLFSSRSLGGLSQLVLIGYWSVLGYPLVNIQKTMENHQLFMGKSTISMVM